MPDGSALWQQVFELPEVEFEFAKLDPIRQLLSLNQLESQTLRAKALQSQDFTQ